MGTLALDPDLQDLASAIDALCSKEVDDTLIHTVADDINADASTVTRSLAELGVVGLAVSERNGGGGAGLMGLAVAAETLGKKMVPGPTLPNALSAYLLDKVGNHDQVVEQLISGNTNCAISLSPGNIVLDSDSQTVQGITAPIIAGCLPEWLILPCDTETRQWVLVKTDEANTDVHVSHDLTRRLVTCTFQSPTTVHLLNLDNDLPSLTAAIVLGAESVGLADWCLNTATQYARTREQFGRPIGQFQGVKHRVARMLVCLEQARALAWDAARAMDSTQLQPQLIPQAVLVASAAGAQCVDAGLEAAKALINTLGGIGFTWEHLAGFYLRRAQTTRVVLGRSADWYARTGTVAISGVERQIDPELPDEAEQLRTEIRAELAPAVALEGEAQIRYLAEAGYTMPTLPQPWGKNADALTQVVIGQELERAGLVPHNMIIGNWVVPSLTAFGNAAQQERFVRPSLCGDIQWCQLFSEPGAGSDLAGLKTKATRTEGGWIISGQKVWTSGARQSDWGILLARTDSEAPKHKGIGYFLLDMQTPGISIRPLREITGDALFNEVFLDDVFIPDDCLVAGPTDGWKVAVTTLANERIHMTGGSAFGNGETALLDTVRQGGKTEDSLSQVRVGQLLSRSLAASLVTLRGLLKSLAGAQPGAESSVAKLVSAENIQDLWEAVIEEAGPEVLQSDYRTENLKQEQLSDKPIHQFLSSRSTTIAGGTTDVQLNIIAERILGLPRD